MKNNHWDEVWKKIEFSENISEKEVYEISNYGRIKSFKKYKQNGIIRKLFSIGGYKKLPLKQKNNKMTGKYIHKLVAENFIDKKHDEQVFVIHLDYDKENNNIINLAWASKKEKEDHHIRSPRYQNPLNRIGNSKLSEGRVKMIKRKLNNPNRKTRMKMIAKQFGISEMQLYRIKTGKNWGYVEVD